MLSHCVGVWYHRSRKLPEPGVWSIGLSQRCLGIMRQKLRSFQAWRWGLGSSPQRIAYCCDCSHNSLSERWLSERRCRTEWWWWRIRSATIPFSPGVRFEQSVIAGEIHEYMVGKRLIAFRDVSRQDQIARWRLKVCLVIALPRWCRC